MPDPAEFYDVIIVGAGPGGSTCALALKDAGLKVALIESKSFPRDKVCGDAIPLRAVKTLNSISPEFIEEFKKFEGKCITRKTRLFYKNSLLDFLWKKEAYACARIHFDNFLFSLVKNKTGVECFENTPVGKIIMREDGITVIDKKNERSFKAKFIVGADGAHSVVAKQLTNQTLDRKHHCGAIRGYYSGVTRSVTEMVEIHLDRKFLPSYLWIFPVADDKVNVGFGMLSDEIARKKINLRKSFQEFIAHSVDLTDRFKNAQLEGELEGFGLPLGSRKVQVSGERFILTGDAASLIDPITGDGIGNAMLSGKIAADQIIDCFKKGDFSAEFISSYDKKLFKVLGGEFRQRAVFQKIVKKMPFMIDLFFWMTKSKRTKEFLQRKFKI